MRRFLGVALAALLLLLAGCGPTKTTIGLVPGHCGSTADTAAICQLKNQKPKFNLTAPLTPQRRGLDSWGPPPLSVLGSYQYGNAYLSTDPTKNWSRASVAAYRAAGKGVVMTWETYATRAAAGRAAGVSDAVEASRQAANDGAPGAPINFAVDFQAGCSQITPYFQGVHSVLGSRAGVYGGYDQIWCVYSQGLVGHQNWQTYAWSGGRWLPARVAPQEQWLNGNIYDQDRALSSSYGQAFQVVPPRDPYRIMDRTRRHFRLRAPSPTFGAPRVVVASEYNTLTEIHRVGCHGAPRRAACKSSKFHLTLLRGRLVRVGMREHPHYRLGGQGARQTIMAKELGRLR